VFNTGAVGGRPFLSPAKLQTMKSLSKEEILERRLNEDNMCHGEDYIDDYGVHDTIYDAMDEYAKQEAIEFFKWNAASIKGYVDYIMRERDGDVDLEEALSKFENSTIEERYNLYLQHKTNNQ